MSFREGHERPQANVRQWQHYIEIFVHVAVVQEVMAIESPEPPRFFDPACFWQMHAPVNVFVKAIVRGECERTAEEEGPLPGQPG